MTNDITALESALAQCQSLAETLMSSATISEGLNCPPVFHAIAKVGVQEFQTKSKAIQRIGTKRKRSGQEKPANAKLTKTAPKKKNDLLEIVKRQPGRPRLKRLQRKQPALPRQVSEDAKEKMLKACTILRRGKSTSN